MPHDSTKPKAPRGNKRRKFVRITAGVVALIVFYFLSFGPVMKLLDQGRIGKNVVESVYLPVLILADKSMAFNKVLDWYVTDVWHVSP